MVSYDWIGTTIKIEIKFALLHVQGCHRFVFCHVSMKLVEMTNEKIQNGEVFL